MCINLSKATYSFEFKLQAVQRALSGEARPAIAKDLGLSSRKILDKWLSAYRSQGEDGLRPKPKGGPKKDTAKPAPVSEVDQLKRRVEYLEAENAYLKALRDLMNNQH
ncbi:helix-turn-helix domain-containing protein [Arcanobacterium phocae]|uniref:helix-turn-helix domain-containing protein n=1 Tax=Arcanobacterium phocae TaxID=131112 RepID=UPI001C0EAAEC|nr:helix-turn-helix domain-containing protein [Arcanobacterium phocae]